MRIKIFWSRKAEAAEAYSKGFVDGATEAVKLMTRHKPRERRPEVLEEVQELEALYKEETNNE